MIYLSDDVHALKQTRGRRIWRAYVATAVRTRETALAAAQNTSYDETKNKNDILPKPIHHPTSCPRQPLALPPQPTLMYQMFPLSIYLEHSTDTTIPFQISLEIPLEFCQESSHYIFWGKKVWKTNEILGVFF